MAAAAIAEGGTGDDGHLLLKQQSLGELYIVEVGGAEMDLVADPRPDQNFFFRSDNIAFALRGIPAHTLSSFNLHEDYHRPSDDVDGIDFEHMTAAVETVIRAVRALADADVAPEWREDGRPERRGR